MKVLLWCAVSIALASSSFFAEADDVEKVTVTTAHPAPSKVSRIATDVELWPPFGRARLIAELNPVNQDVVRLSLEYAGRAHIIDHPLLRTTKRINAKGILILNITKRVNGRDVNGAYIDVPYVGDGTTDECSYRSFRLILFPDGTVDGRPEP